MNRLKLNEPRQKSERINAQLLDRKYYLIMNRVYCFQLYVLVHFILCILYCYDVRPYTASCSNMIQPTTEFAKESLSFSKRHIGVVILNTFTRNNTSLSTQEQYGLCWR